MSQENITIELPNSGMTAIMKPYISHKASRQVSSIFLGKQKINAEEIAKSKNGEESAREKVLSEIVLEGDDLVRYYDILVEALLVQIGEHYAVSESLQPFIDDLPEDDFMLLREKAVEINNEHLGKTSPKE